MEPDKDQKRKINSSENKDVQEPIGAYSKRIFFSTLAEQEEENYRYWLNLTPEQRIANSTYLIQQLYADVLQQQHKPTRIIFDSL